MAYTKLASLISSLTPELIDWIGTPVRAAGWYGPNSGLHTISMKVANFTGTIYIEGTLCTNPLETDWFPILLNGASSLVFAAEFNTPPDGWIPVGYYGTTKSLGFNFVCNCTLLRARMIRNYVISPYATGWQIATYGAIDNIVVCY